MSIDTAAEDQSGHWVRRLLVTAAVAVLAVLLLYFLHRVSQVLLIFFAGTLLALLLDGGALMLAEHARLPRRWALFTFCIVLLAALVAVGWFTGDRIASQLDELGRRLPQAWQQFRDYVMQFSWVRSLADDLPDGNSIDGAMLSRATQFFSATFGAVVSLIIIVFVGVYLAATPGVYIRTALALLPPARRPRARQVLATLGRALRRWLAGRLLSMLVIGVLTGLVLWLIGLPLALPLGLIAGLLSFIPYLGPIVAAVPGILIGFSEGTDLAIHAALAYWGVQMVEGYLVTPLIERKAVHIPPAFQITVQLVGGVLAGLIGVLLASPLLVVATVLVQLLYIEDVLGESPTVVGND